jgi:hypothetical protein
MENTYPLYSVIIDTVEVGTVGSDEDAQSIAGDSIVFINEERPLNVSREVDYSIERTGYYVKADSVDFNNTQLAKNLQKIVNSNSNFKDLETKNNDSEDFEDVAVWSLKTMLLEAYSLNKG